MLEKVKSWGIAVGVAIIATLLLLLRIKTKHLEAARYKLKVEKGNKKINQIQEDIDLLDRKIEENGKVLSMPYIRESLHMEMERLEAKKEEDEKIYNELISFINSKRESP